MVPPEQTSEKQAGISSDVRATDPKSFNKFTVECDFIISHWKPRYMSKKQAIMYDVSILKCTENVTVLYFK